MRAETQDERDRRLIDRVQALMAAYGLRAMQAYRRALAEDAHA